MDEISVRLDGVPTLRVSIETNESKDIGTVNSHASLKDRSLADQHPISAITGLEDALKSAVDAEMIESVVNSAIESAKSSGEFDGADGNDGEDGYTPVRGVDYDTPEDREAIKAYIAAELAKRGQLVPEYANSIEECTDTSKMYVLPDGMIWAYMLTEKEVESGAGYTNVIPTSKDTDGVTVYGADYNGDGANDGYLKSTRLSGSSGSTATAGELCCATGFITAKVGDIVRIKGAFPIEAVLTYVVSYDSSKTKINNQSFQQDVPGNGDTPTWETPTGMNYSHLGAWYTIEDDNCVVLELTSDNFGTGIEFIRFSGHITDSTIITINEEIAEGGGTETVTEYDWANTGLAFVPADYEDRIIALENEVSQNSADIENLKKGITTSTPIKEWDAPIYDTNIPVFELSVEKDAMTNAPCTPSDIYARYDALMAKHPRYIQKTDLGLCSDGVNHIYRYDFREPEPLHESNKEWSETKAKAIIVTGIHFEWAGIYAMYNALEEIADNPELRDFRRNTHLIVVPCCNPYATVADNYSNSVGVRNANGVEIHRNFEVDWALTEEGTTHYGGSEPLSEVETQYIDDILKNNTDAALFLSCHNCGVDTFWGTGFIWASTATKYMCNMGYRVIDKLSDAWMDKYGDSLAAGIAEYKTDSFEDGETRLGWTGISTSPGTEAKQATKYGIQGTNVEICNPFQIHGTKAEPEPSMSAFTMSRGAEVYVNFLLTAFGTYDPKDKKEYAQS